MCRAPCKVMKLSDHFDVVLGKPWLARVERAAIPGTFEFSFDKNVCEFKRKDPKSQRVVCHRISSTCTSPATLEAPLMCAAYLQQHIASHKEIDLASARLIHITDDLNILNTIHGDNYVPVDSVDVPTFMSMTAPAQPQQADVPSEENLIQDAVKSCNKDNWATPSDDPNYEPASPEDISEQEDFSDDTLFERCKHDQNTPEKIDAIGRENNVDLRGILLENAQVFSDQVPTGTIPDRGQWNAEMRFKDEADAQRPICIKPYRLAPDEARAAAEIFRDMLLRGTIRPSKSPWGTPVFLVPKAEGGWRLCCDYRALNSKLVRESYSIPAADQMFDQLGDARVFSTHDCTWGYHQLRWSQKSIPITAIRTHLGTFEFLTMNFGPTAAPSQWTRLMETILRPYLNKFCVIYLDDLTIYSRNAEEHARHLRLVYRLLAKNKIFLRLGKCYFFQKKIKFLGWILEGGKLSADPHKIETLLNWPKPDCKKEVRSITGFANFYKRLIRNFTKLMAPLFDLQRDEVPNTRDGFAPYWTEVHDHAFAELKKALTSDLVVRVANPKLPYLLEVDASQVAVGGILMQQHPDAPIPQVVEYYSKRCGPSQSNYFPGKLELLGLVVCLEHWKYYLRGAPQFKIITDHEPLKALRTTKNPNRLEQRWMHFIDQFSFEIVHKPGKDMPSDLLSRPPDGYMETKHPLEVTDIDNENDEAPRITEDSDADNAELGPSELSAGMFYYYAIQTTDNTNGDVFYDSELISEATLEDIRLANAKDDFFEAARDKPELAGKFQITDGLLFDVQDGRNRLYIPPSLPRIRRLIFEQAHGTPTSGHFGVTNTELKIKRYYFWPRLKTDLKEWIGECQTCLTTKRRLLPRSPFLPHEVPIDCWDVVFLDGVGPLPESNGCDQIWIFMDKLSRMVHFVPSARKGYTSESLAKDFFSHIYRLHGMPLKLVSDDDPKYQNFFKKVMEIANVKSNISTPDHPQTDSSGEAGVKLCIDVLRQFVNSNQNDWYDLLPAIEFACNDAPGPSGRTPFEINNCRHPRSAESLLSDLAIEAQSRADPSTQPASQRSAHQLAVDRMIKHRETIRNVRAALERSRERMAEPERTVKHVYRAESFEVDDLVYVRREAAKLLATQNKLAPQWIGPFRVVKVISPVAYVLNFPPSVDPKASRTVNISNLRRAPVNSAEITQAATDGNPLEPLTPLVEPTHNLKIRDITHEVDSTGKFELYASTDHGKHAVHTLHQRGHLRPIVDFLSVGHNVRKLNLLHNLGSRCLLKDPWQMVAAATTGTSTRTGIGDICLISAFDPSNERYPYYVEHPDLSRSGWYSSDSLTIKAKPKPPTQHRRRAIPARLNSFVQTGTHQDLLTMVKQLSGKLVRSVRILDLGSGPNKSVSRCFDGTDLDVIVDTLDIGHDADIQCDLNNWNYLEHFPSGYHDIIWASPECKEFSRAKTVGKRDLYKAVQFVKAVFDTIELADPKAWFVENPAGSNNQSLDKLPFMKKYRRFLHRCTYCWYGTTYQKPTCIWSNVPLELKNCLSDPCAARLKFGHHHATAQSGRTTLHAHGTSTRDANRVPAPLLEYLFAQAANWIDALW